MFIRPVRARMAALALPMLLALSACATGFDAKVSRFQAELPAPAGQTFAIVAEDPRDQGGLEFAQYASIVAAQLQRVGYVPGNPQTSDLIVRFDYGVDQGRDKVQTTGFSDPYWGGWYGPGFGGWGGAGAGAASMAGAAAGAMASTIRGSMAPVTTAWTWSPCSPAAST